MNEEYQYVYAGLLGKLVANIQALEFGVRFFLTNYDIFSSGSLSPKINLMGLKENDLVSINALTRFDYFSDAVREYNQNSLVIRGNYQVDNNLAITRNAVVHGLVYSPYGVKSPPNFKNAVLLKFKKQTKKEKETRKVSVELCITLTEQWLNDNIQLFREAILKVYGANESLKIQK